MHFHFAFVVNFLFAFVVLADRRREHRQLLNRMEKSTTRADTSVGGSAWAGAVVEKDVETFTSVKGTFTIPALSGDVGSAVSAWVGLDGGACSTSAGLFQAGVDCGVTVNGTSCAAWQEWYPATTSYFEDLPTSAGDLVVVTVTALSTMSGTVLVENLTSGQSMRALVNSTHPVCGQNAEWIVEEFGSPDGEIPLANFGKVTFTDTVAAGENGAYTVRDGPRIVEIVTNGETLTSTTIDGSSLVVKYL